MDLQNINGRLTKLMRELGSGISTRDENELKLIAADIDTMAKAEVKRKAAPKKAPAPAEAAQPAAAPAAKRTRKATAASPAKAAKSRK